MSKNTKSSLVDTKSKVNILKLFIVLGETENPIWLFKLEKKSSQNQAIISAAFQDHICKQLQLDSIYINPLKTANKNSTRIKTNQIKSKTDSGLRSMLWTN